MNNGNNKAILIVEDEAILAMQEKIELEKYGYNVHHVCTGENAVETILKEQLPIDLILMDINLGKGIDGTQAAEEILKFKDIPIVFLSSHTEAELVELTEKISSYGYIVKGTNITVLDASIKMAFKLFEVNKALLKELSNRKRAEKAFQESEKKYKAAFMTSPDSININRMDGLYVDINDGFTALTGYTRDDVIGKLSAEIAIWSIPEDREKLVKELREKGVVENLESVFRCKDGSLKTALMSARVITIDNEQYILSVTRDISERKQMEGKLAAEENSLRITLNSIGDAVISTDDQGRIVRMNPVAERLCGWTLTDAAGKSLTDIFHIINSDTRNSVADPVKKVLQSGEIIGLANHTVLISKNGKEYQIADSAAPIVNQKGEISGVVLVFSDVTEKYQIQKQIKESEERYRALYNNAPLSYQSLDENGCFLDINPMWLKTLGYKRDEVIGKCFGDFLHPDYIEHFKISFAAFKKRGYVSDVQFQLRRKNNTYIYVSFEGRVGYTPGGKFEQSYCVFKDITEQKALENALIKAKEKAERNENELLKAQEIAHLGSWYLNVETNEVTWTEELYKMYDFDPSLPPPPYTRHMTLFTDESWEILSKSLAKTRETGIPYELELKTVKKDGKNGWMWVRGEAVKDDGNNIIGIWGAAQDITERKRVEEKLKTSDRVFKHSLDMLCIAGFDGYFKVLNPAWSKTLAWTDEELLSKPWIDFVHPDDRDATKDIKSVIVDGKEVYQFENRYICKDGSIKWLSWNSFPYPEENIMFGVARDITVSKQRELMINNFFEQPLNLNLVAGFDGKIHRVNSAWELFLGYKKDEILKADFFDFIHPDDISITIEEMEKLGKGITTLHFENRYRHKNGEYRKLAWSAISSLDENLIYAVAFDITEKQQAEEQMRFLSAITENMHDSIVVTDLEGHITYINKGAEKLYGYRLEELAGKSPDLFNVDSKADEIQSELYETVARGETFYGEALNQRKDGTVFTCEFTIAPLKDKMGAVTSFIGLQRDITEKRNLEKAVIRQERLSAIGELASGVAHDFNNALQIIMGGVEMAMVAEDPVELNQYLQSIKHSAGDAASRVRKLQRFAQKSQFQNESIPININHLSDDVIKEAKLLINQYQEKGIHIELKTDYQAKSNIEGNEGELRSCLYNLIKNSTEAMPDGGKITISTYENDAKIYVRVTDSGTGMDKEAQKKIFQPFFSTKGFEPGRGLGMAQVYSTIRDHRGDIYIKKSEPGKGTVIEFALPVTNKQSVIEKKPEDYIGTAKILWVDDEELIRNIGKEMLKSLGHIADFAASGEEALKLLANGNKYDLIITDIGMPGMSGWQLAEQIKAIGYHVKIAVVTGWGAEVSQEEKEKYNVGYVLGKPVLISNLKSLIGEVLQMKKKS